MNNRRNSAVASKKRRRTVRVTKRDDEMHREQIASFRRSTFIQHHAQFGLKSWQGNPIFFPKRTKFKGYMRTA